ncbi:probable small nuclear ribonucleoprotein Sm D2 [Atheta coriaria]|uniref:probable small nuclear ribonucleoprotein Sm D2 n=1 Tax=Dalotia coriaria TaxID=877792 RepID=UPI0031F3ED26
MNQQLAKQLSEEFTVGPYSLLQQAVFNNTQVLISCRNNKKLLGRVTMFDRHMNMVIENVREMWIEPGRKDKGRKCKKSINRDRFISKMFLRGDSVILVVCNAVSVSK